MPTNKVERFSQMERLVKPLTGLELMVLSRKQAIGRKTVNITTDTLARDFHRRLQGEDIQQVITTDESIIGTGSDTYPLIIDPDIIGGSLLKLPTNLNITTVGDRNVRFLPISRTRIHTHNYPDVKTNSKQLPSFNIEPTGELRVVAPSTSAAYFACYGQYSKDKNLKSEQLIEREFKANRGFLLNNVSDFSEYTIKEMFAYDGAYSALTLVNHKATNIDHFFMVNFSRESLSEAEINAHQYLCPVNSVLGKEISENPCIVTWMLEVGYLLILREPKTVTDKIDIKVYTLKANASETELTYTPTEGWTSQTVAGGWARQPTVVIANRLYGTLAQQGLLIPHASYDAELLLGDRKQSLSTTNVDIAKKFLHLHYRSGLQLVNKTTKKRTKHIIDLSFRLDFSRTNGGTLNSLPDVADRLPEVTGNDAELIRYPIPTCIYDQSSMYAEVGFVLRDGSYVIGLMDTTNKKPFKIFPSKRGHLHGTKTTPVLNVREDLYNEPILMDWKPGYVDTDDKPSIRSKLYIASPIRFILSNGLAGEIPPQILDLSQYTDPKTNTLRQIGTLPYVLDRYRNNEAYPVHLYIQHTGTQPLLIKSNGPVPEDLGSTYFASVWFLSSGESILTGQAFSRMGRHRLSYSPRGWSVPVSYDHPMTPPKQVWLGQSSESISGAGGVEFIVTLDSGQLTIPPGYRANILMVGGGGGGGGAIHNYSSSNYKAPSYGFDGGDTMISLSISEDVSQAIICGGGKGGTGANWGNGSAFSNGKAGEGGKILRNDINQPNITVVRTIPGITPPIGSRWNRQVGGNSVFGTIFPLHTAGEGGAGAWGVGDEQHSFGGGGGSGAGAEVIVNNSSNKPIYLECHIGELGGGRPFPIPGTNGNPGANAGSGCIMMELIKL